MCNQVTVKDLIKLSNNCNNIQSIACKEVTDKELEKLTKDKMSKEREKVPAEFFSDNRNIEALKIDKFKGDGIYLMKM